MPVIIFPAIATTNLQIPLATPNSRATVGATQQTRSTAWHDHCELEQMHCSNRWHNGVLIKLCKAEVGIVVV